MMGNKKLFKMLLASLYSLTLTAHQPPWWHGAVIYEIYPRSFADSNHDGIGDLPGIIKNLDYLQNLGVDAIWLTPFFKSPQIDCGYDVSDYMSINPEYGTLDDFDRLIQKAHHRNIRVLIDFVPAHTSSQHPWFISSSNLKDSPYRDWYIWKDGKNGTAPNNWASLFGGSAWEFDATTQQYYYHFFLKEQPALNWRNPAVKQALYNVAHFWLKHGIDGFRLDAIGVLLCDQTLQDNPIVGILPDGTPKQSHIHTMNQPEVHELLKELRTLTNTYSATILLGETEAETVNALARYLGDKNELHLVMNFFMAYIDQLNAQLFKQRITEWNNVCEQSPYYFLSNHDVPRHIDRYSNGIHADEIARLLAALLLTLRGTIQLYYGEEIGMHTLTIPTTTIDPSCNSFWPQIARNRDGCRTPMQWNSSLYSGFSDQKPWLPLHPEYVQCNVEEQIKKPDSLLNWYRQLIALRKKHKALKWGSYTSLPTTAHQTFTYLRSYDSEKFIIMLNMSNHKQALNMIEYNLNQPLLPIASSLNIKHDRSTQVTLAPFEAYIAQLP